MQLPEIICAVIVSALSVFLMIAGYVLQKQRYWKQVWESLGRPEVGSVKELKALQKEQTAHAHRGLERKESAESVI